GCERRGRIGLQDGLVRGPRVGETAETKEGFALPELHLERPARRWLKGLRAFEGLERRFVVADGQPGASEQQYGVGQARVLGELLDESLQRTTGNRHDAVGRRALALDHERRALDGTSLEPGARDAIEGARAAGFAVALWTNNAREITADVLDRFGLLGGFDLIVTRDEMDALKPDPAGWRVIRERFGDCAAVVVGDSWVDGVAAAAAGVPFVAYRPRLE